LDAETADALAKAEDEDAAAAALEAAAAESVEADDETIFWIQAPAVEA